MYPYLARKGADRSERKTVKLEVQRDSETYIGALIRYAVGMLNLVRTTMFASSLIGTFA